MACKYSVVAFLSTLGKSLNLSKNNFLQSFSKPTNKLIHPPTSRWDQFQPRSWPWKGLSNICVRFKKCPWINFLKLHGKQAERGKRQIKTKFCILIGMQDIEKWFGRYDATLMLHDASLDSFVNEAFLPHNGS